MDSLISRRLVLGWCLWLLFSWVLHLLLRSPVHMTAETIAPIIQWMLLSIGVGMWMAWPMWRLSMRRLYRPLGFAIGDIVVMLIILQIILWPTRVLIAWNLDALFAAEMVFLAWSLPITAWVYLGMRTDARWMRSLMMLLCVLTLFGGPIVALLGGPNAWAGWTPFRTLWILGSPDPWLLPRLTDLLPRLLIIALLGAGVWVLVALFGRAGRSFRVAPHSV